MQRVASPLARLNRILVCFPAALHPALEPPLMALITGADETEARAHLAALAAIPGLRLYGWASESDAPLPERVTLAAPGGLHCYLRREADGRWRLDRARAWGSGVWDLPRRPGTALAWRAQYSTPFRPPAGHPPAG